MNIYALSFFEFMLGFSVGGLACLVFLVVSFQPRWKRDWEARRK